MNRRSDKIIKLYLVKEPGETYSTVKNTIEYFDLYYDIDNVPTPTLIYFRLSYTGLWEICTHYDTNPLYTGNSKDCKEYIRDSFLATFKELIDRELIRLDL